MSTPTSTTQPEAATVTEQPKPKDLTDREKRAIVLTALVKAGADLLAGWDDKRVPKSEVKQYLADRLKYCASASWDKRLGADPRKASTS